MADRSVVYRLRADVAQFRAQMATAAASVKDAGDKMTASTAQGAKYRKGLTTLGNTAGKVGLVAGAGLAAVVIAAANFDQAMSRVQAATHETSANMDLLRAAAIKAGQDTKYSATEAADGVEALAKAGVSTKDILAGGLTGALNLAAAGNQSVGDAAETAASAMTQFKLSGKDIPHIADLLAAGAGKAQGDVSDLAMALNQVGLVASQTGLNINETTAGLSAFASAGLIGSDAGTSFKTMLLRLTPQSSAAQKQMDALGISAYDSQGQFIGLAKYAGVLHNALQGMSAEQRNATLKTIFGQDAIRAASVLYEQGAQGITDWTQKVNDQGYAAETAGIKMNNLMGDLEQLRGSLETAFIGTGEGSQGPLRKLVQGLTSVVNAYDKLPSGAHNAAQATLAVTAALGGGLFVFTKVVAGAASVRTALEQVGVSGTRLTAVMRGVRFAGLAFAGYEAGVLVLGKLQDAMAKTVPGVNQLQSSLLDLEQTGQSAALASTFNDLGFAIDRIANKSTDQKVHDTISTIATLGQMDNSELRNAQTEITGLDGALAALVSQGHADAAAKALSGLAQQQGLTASQTAALSSHLPQYREALAGIDVQAKLAGGATKTLGRAAGGAAPQVTKLDKALEASRKAANQTAQGFITLGKGLSDNKVSLRQWIHQLQQQADALRNFRQNAETAAHKGLDQGLTAALEKAGPAGALRMRQLANATKSEIAKANAAWEAGQREVNRYTDAVGGVPASKTTHLTVDTGDAMSKVIILRQEIDQLHGKTVMIRAIGGHVVQGHADGGTIGGQRHPYGDKVLSWLAPGEEVITNRNGEADRFRSDRASGRIPRYADGGTVGGHKGQIAADERQIHTLTKSLDRLSKAVDGDKQSRDNIRQKQQALSSGLAGSLRSDLFGSTSAWGSASSPVATLQADITNARAYNKGLHALAKKGLNGGAFEALASSGNLQAVQAEAGMSRAQIAQYERLYNTRQHLTASTGAYAGQVRYSRQLDRANAVLDAARGHLHNIQAEIKRLNTEVTHLRHEAKGHAKTTGKAAGDAVNGSAAHAARRTKRT